MHDFVSDIDLVPAEAGEAGVSRVFYRGVLTDLLVSPDASPDFGICRSAEHAAHIVRKRILEKDLRDVEIWLIARNPGATFALNVKSHYAWHAEAHIAWLDISATPRELRQTLRGDAMRALSALGWLMCNRVRDTYVFSAVWEAEPSAHERLKAISSLDAALSLVWEGVWYPRRRLPRCRGCRSGDVLWTLKGRPLVWNLDKQDWHLEISGCAPNGRMRDGYRCRSCGGIDIVIRYADNDEPCDIQRGLYRGEALTRDQISALSRARILDLPYAHPAAPQQHPR